MTFLELKPLTREQLSAISELDQLCFGGFWTREGYQRELDSPNSHFLGLLIPPPPASPALIGMGCFWAILEEAHITMLAVHPHYRRQGLGQTSLIALLTAARYIGLERATLEVRASNSAALSLYQTFGFKTAGRRRRYYQDTNEDALILWRGDLQTPEFQHSLSTWQSATRDRLATFGWDLRANWNSPIPKKFLTEG